MAIVDIAEVLRQNGYKVTPQRLAVYAVIEHNPTHPNAEVIYRELQPQYPSMSLATVYKTMEIFAKIGVKYCNAVKMPIVTIIIQCLTHTFAARRAIKLQTWTLTRMVWPRRRLSRQVM